MKTRIFRPDEVFFSPTTQCNLRCTHCDIKKHPAVLSIKTSVRFLDACASAGVKRVGFTGGEPFLALHFLWAITKEAVGRQMSFSRIMTNGACFRNKGSIVSALKKLFCAGYDGDICVSVDAFHDQDLRKVASFIRTAADIWKRPDLVSIAAVKGALENNTRRRLARLAHLLKARFINSSYQHASIKNKGLFIRISYIDLSPVGKAGRLKNPWDGRWFKDDFCKGPGNVFFILPDGKVKPCCGYANDTDLLTIGFVKRDTPQKLIQNAQKNRFVSTIFGSGLHPVRKALERSGIHFPGKTTNHCFFCHYLTSYVPRLILKECFRKNH